MARTPAGLPKTNQNASPTPAGAQAWAMRQQGQPESYQYSQLSPSRSPSGPTYTQLSSGINSRPSYHTTTSAQQQAPQPGEIFLLFNSRFD
jgi:aryl hydrocarbon receptor nuclear translocator